MEFSYRSLLVQLVIVFFCAVFFLLASEAGSLVAALYGGVIAVANSCISAYIIKAAYAFKDSKQTMLLVFLSSIMRFIFIGIVFYLAFALFKLSFVAVVVTFALAQFSYFFSFKNLEN